MQYQETAESLVSYLVIFTVSVFLWMVVNSYRSLTSYIFTKLGLTIYYRKVLARPETRQGMDYVWFQQEGGFE